MSAVEVRPAEARAPARSARRMLTLRGQVLGVVLVINGVAALLAGWIVVLNARTATRNEMAASVEMAEQMVREAAERVAVDPQALEEALPRHLRHLRHVRLSLSDAAGRPLNGGGDEHQGPSRGRAPEWFARLVGVEGMTRYVPITAGGATLGQVEVAGVPDDEVAEVWDDASDFITIAVGVNGAILLALFLALGRVRQDLGQFRTALGKLEHGDLNHPLPAPRIRELAEAADGVNALAEALAAARGENVRLSARLVRLEDDERRRIAGELHDELGPLMFGLKAGADSLARMAGQAPPELSERLATRAAILVDIVERMQGANRRLLRRLRPTTLGQVPFGDVISGLIADFRQHDPERVFLLELGPLRAGYGAAVEATLYRCAQEGVTNALRHGDARTVALSLCEKANEAGRAGLHLAVRDDGRGLPPRGRDGLGLAGMRERVRALGGLCVLAGAESGGACLTVEIPLAAASDLRRMEKAK